MNVAILGIKQLPATAGADRVVESLLQHGRAEHQYHVYVRRTPGAPPTPSPRVSYVQIPAPGGKHVGPFTYFLLCALHFVFKSPCRVAHVHNSDFGLMCLLLRAKRGVRLIGTFHGDAYRRAKWGRLARGYLRVSAAMFAQCCDALTSVSSARKTARGLSRLAAVRHIPNGIDDQPAAGSPGTGRSGALLRAGLPDHGYLLFACGRLDPTKGLHTLLSAFARTRCTERLLVLGDFGHDRAYSAEIERTVALDERVVVYRGLLPKDTLLEVVRRARLCIFPSEVEAMSMMLLEYIACRRPVLCSDIPENLEVVGPRHPLLFRAGDADDLRRALVLALARTDLDETSEQLLQSCQSRFAWSAIAQAYEALYGPAPRVAVRRSA